MPNIDGMVSQMQEKEQLESDLQSMGLMAHEVERPGEYAVVTGLTQGRSEGLWGLWLSWPTPPPPSLLEGVGLRVYGSRRGLGLGVLRLESLGVCGGGVGGGGVPFGGRGEQFWGLSWTIAGKAGKQISRNKSEKCFAQKRKASLV